MSRSVVLNARIDALSGGGMHGATAGDAVRSGRIVIGLLGLAVGCGGATLNPGGPNQAGTAGTTGGAGSTGEARATGLAGTIDTGTAGTTGGTGGITGDAIGTAGTVGTAGSLGTAGAIGTGGSAGSTGGSAGTGGSSLGGTGGAGTGGAPVLPACTNTGSDTGGGSIIGPDGMLVAAPVTAAVTVASVAPPVANQPGQIVLASADQRQWTLSLFISVMPPDLIRVGDAFDLKVDASVDATFHPFESDCRT
jgi:hypothetical protein